MEPVKKIIEHTTNPLTIELPDGYENKKSEVTVFALEDIPKKKDLNKYFGKLEWKGDALEEQKKLRDEWS